MQSNNTEESTSPSASTTSTVSGESNATEASRHAGGVSAYLLMAGAALSFSWMGAITKWAAKTLPSSEIVLFRGVWMTLVILWLARRNNVSLRGKRWGLLLWRGGIGSAALLCFFYAISQISLSNAITLNLASPVFVMLFAALWLRETPRPFEVILMGAALFGALLIVQPGTALFQWAALIGLLSAVLSGMAYALVRKLSETEHRLSIIFAFSWTSCVISLPLAWPSFVWPSWLEFLQLNAISALALGGQVLLTAAYEKERAGPVASVSYLGVVFAGLWGFIFWGEVPNLWAGIGTALLVGACVLLSVGRVRGKRKDAISE